MAGIRARVRIRRSKGARLASTRQALSRVRLGRRMQRFRASGLGRATFRFNKSARGIQRAGGAKTLQRTLMRTRGPLLGAFAQKVTLQRQLRLSNGRPDISPRKIALSKAAKKAARTRARGLAATNRMITKAVRRAKSRATSATSARGGSNTSGSK